MLCLCYFLSSSFIFFFFFNDHLEQRDLGNYKVDLHQILRGGRHVGVDVQSGSGFTIGQGMATNFRRKIGDAPSFLGLAFHNGWQDGKADGCVNSAEVLSTSYKNFVNFGRLTLWWWFGDHLCAKCAKSSKCIRFLRLTFDNAWQEPLEGFVPNSHRRHVWSFTQTNLNVKVKGQGHQGQKTVLCTDNTPAVWMEWNAVIADNIAQAADATIRSLQRGFFARMHALGLAVYRWAQPHICS